MKIIPQNINTPDALILLDELSATLQSITGDSGNSSFNPNDFCVSRSLFVIAYDEGGEAIGCGGIRQINENIAEVKRLFAKTSKMGIGTEVLLYLETQARKLGYHALWLETRLINEQAVSFYENRGYYNIPNYGKYINNSKAICYEKKIN